MVFVLLWVVSYVFRHDDDDSSDNEERRQAKVASVAVTAETVLAFARDPLTHSRGDPAKLFQGVMAKPRVPDDPSSKESGKKKKKKKAKKEQGEVEGKPKPNVVEVEASKKV